MKDASISSFNVITDSGTAINNHVASYTASKQIHDSGLVTTNLFLADGTVPITGILNQSNTTNSTLVSNGSIITLGGIGLSKALFAGGKITTSDTTASSSVSTGCIVGSGGLGIAGASNFGGKVTISTASVQGLDLATSDSYANLRVIQNSTGPDKDIYIGFNSAATSSLHLYSNNFQTVFINKGNTVVGAAVTTTATDGFLYIPTVNGTKTGIPTTYSGTIPMVFDTSVNKLVVYTGGTWKSVGPFT